jgi:hypothetical protein
MEDLMSVLKRPASIVLTGAALVAAMGLAAMPASAAAKKTWTITRGGAVTATAKAFTLGSGGESLKCGPSTVKVKLKSGKGLAGANAGTVTSAGVTGCSLLDFKVTITAGRLPWHLNLVSYNAAKGVTTLTVTGIHIAVAVPTFGCTAVIDGTAGSAGNGMLQATYTNKTGALTTLKTGGKLHLYDVKNCDGVVSNGASVTFGATYTVTPKQKITSP